MNILVKSTELEKLSNASKNYIDFWGYFMNGLDL